MKKTILLVSICIFVLCSLLFLQLTPTTEEKISYYSAINDLVKAREFYTAVIHDKTIILRDAGLNETASIPFPQYNRFIPVKLITKNQVLPIIYVSERNSFDDAYGVLIVNGDISTEQLSNGVYLGEKIAENMYLYGEGPI